MAGREQLPLRQAEGFGAGLVLPRAEATLRVCLQSRSAPSPSMGDIPADPPAVEPPRSESPSPSEEKDPSEPAAAPQSARAPPLLPEAASGIPADTGSEQQSSDHPDGESSSSWGEQRLSLGAPQPEGSMEQGQEFPLLEVSGEWGDSSHPVCPGTAWLSQDVSVDGALPSDAPRDSRGLKAPSTAVGTVGVLAGVGGPWAARASSDLSPGLGRTRSSWTAACSAARPAWAASASTGHRPCAPPPPRGTAGSSGTPRVSPAGMGTGVGCLSWHGAVVTLSLCPHRAPASPDSVLRRGGSGGAPEPAHAWLPLGQGGQGAALSRPQRLRHQGETLGLLCKGGWNTGKLRRGGAGGWLKAGRRQWGDLGGQSTVCLPDLSLCP